MPVKMTGVYLDLVRCTGKRSHQALKSVNYEGPVVIESFTPQVKEIARAVIHLAGDRPQPGCNCASRVCNILKGVVGMTIGHDATRLYDYGK